MAGVTPEYQALSVSPLTLVVVLARISLPSTTTCPAVLGRYLQGFVQVRARRTHRPTATPECHKPDRLRTVAPCDGSALCPGLIRRRRESFDDEVDTQRQLPDELGNCCDTL